MRLRLLTLALLAPLLMSAGAANAHEGRLDKNGCHYEHTNGGKYHCHRSGTPNTESKAPVKKSRENICHDSDSPNYLTMRFFISYQSMAECMASGGRMPNN